MGLLLGKNVVDNGLRSSTKVISKDMDVFNKNFITLAKTLENQNNFIY